MLSGGIKEGQLVLRTKGMHCVKKTTIIVGFTIIRPSENTRKKTPNKTNSTHQAELPRTKAFAVVTLRVFHTKLCTNLCLKVSLI